MDTINVKDTPDDIQKKLHPYDFSELRRRSARISLLDEVKQIAPENVTLTPKQETGKRSHDAMIAGSRSANAKLQSSKSKIWDVPLDEAQHGPQTKKPKKVINKELIEKKKKSISPPIESEGEESEVEEKKEELKYAPGSRVRTKKWLTEGIYAGTDPEAAARRGRKGRTSTSKKRKPILPLPIYKGLEILNTQRDMKLPFHIYSASPYKLHPEGWKKRNRSKPLFHERAKRNVQH